MCNCAEMCRTFDETPIGFSPSIHHPSCEDYVLVEYSRIHCAGMGSVVVENGEAEDWIETEVENGEPRASYSISKILLTVDQFESMPEFDGF